jgi:light-harvesting complex I chlorophyll a/b binding protein 4
LQATILAACIAGASAFSAAPAMIRSRTSSGITGMQMQAKSASVPFLTRPAKLDGKMVGDVGFDPLGFTEKYDIKWLQESEIKHGRVAMLAVLGTLVQEIIRLPFEATSNPNPAEAFFQVPAGGLGQIFVTIGLIEHFSHNFKMSGSSMFSTGRKPGVFGFDPLGFGKNPDAFKRYELAEIKNGRLAMLGFSGIIHGAFITGKGPIAALTSLSYPY